MLQTQDEESEDDDDVPTGQSIGGECRVGVRMYKRMCGRVKRKVFLHLSATGGVATKDETTVRWGAGSSNLHYTNHL